MAKTERVIRAKTGDRGLIYVVVGPNGEGAKKLLEELERDNKVIFSIAPGGDGVHYILQNRPEMPSMVPGQQMR